VVLTEVVHLIYICLQYVISPVASQDLHSEVQFTNTKSVIRLIDAVYTVRIKIRKSLGLVFVTSVKYQCQFIQSI